MTPDPGQPTTHAQAYRARAAAVTHLVAGASVDQWSAASPCEEWDARDVLSHMVHTQRDFLRERQLDPGPLPTDAEPEAQWTEHTGQVASLLDDPQTRDQQYDGFFGPTTVGETISQFYGWDMLVHRWDIAMAMRRDPQLSEADLDAIEQELPMFGDALYAPGICAPPVDVGSSASRTDRVMARLGRDTGGVPRL